MSYELTPENISIEFGKSEFGSRKEALQYQIELLVKQVEERGQNTERRRCLEILGKGVRESNWANDLEGLAVARALTQAQQEIGEWPPDTQEPIYVG